jgi:predicted nucleic acid-binding protein
MHKKIVINTGPVLALVAGLGNLDVLSKLYYEVYVTKEVETELMVDGIDRFAAKEFVEAGFLIK